MNQRVATRILLYVAMLAMALYLMYMLNYNSKQTSPPRTQIPIEVSYNNTSYLLDEAQFYCDSLGFRTDFAILINLALHSGNSRLFGFNLDTKETLIKGLVAHGHCKSTDNRYAQFSNAIGSNCSSLGRYKIGQKYKGKFGVSYKLHGLDSSNSHALERHVVLHSHVCIPLLPQDDDICLSEGCPTVNPAIFAELSAYIDQSDQPILVWIYN